MAVPDFQSLMLPALKVAGDEKEHNLSETLEILAERFSLSDEDRAETLRSGQSRFYNRLGWSITYLKKAKLLTSSGPGRFKITERGNQLLQSPPSSININFLERNYPEMLEFRRTRELEEEPPASFNESTRQWASRAEAEERLLSLLESINPSKEVRLNALKFFASGIEIADQERETAWYVKETDRDLRLMTGRLLALSISRLRARIGVLARISHSK